MKPLNIYLDIDGVIRGCTSPQADIAEFLRYCLEHYPDSMYWLTTHCKHGYNHAAAALQGYLPQDLVDELSIKVQPAEWEVLKTDGIDKGQDFVWFDDNLFESEQRVLEAYCVADSYFRMDPRDPAMAKKALEYLKSLA